jgi:hypothetical protein
MKFRVKTHSVIDLITNSSTEMFVDYSNSIEPIKELVNEFLSMQAVNLPGAKAPLTCDDIFELKIVDPYTGEKWINDGENASELEFTVINPKYEKLAALIKKVLFSAETSEYQC